MGLQHIIMLLNISKINFVSSYFIMSIKIREKYQSSEYVSTQVMMIKISKRSAHGRRDIFSGQRRNKAHKISFSNKKSRKWQRVNIKNRMIYWSEGERFVKLRISSRSMR